MAKPAQRWVYIGGAALIAVCLAAFLAIWLITHQSAPATSRCTLQLPEGHVALELVGPRAASYCGQLVADTHVGWTYTSKRGKAACSFQLDGASGTFFADEVVIDPELLCRGWGPGIPKSG